MSKCFYVSNRLPFQLRKNSNGETEIVRSAGGLVTALLGVKNQSPTYWIGTTTDTRIVNISKSVFKDNFPFEDIISVLLSKDLHNSYYNDFCNDVIWPLFHYESQRVKYSEDAWKSYVEVNRLMAEEISKHLSDNDTIWIHDFHFFLLAKFLREYNKNIRIGFFLHIPFPSSEIFRQLPVRNEILEGLLNCDLIGFHDYSYLRHFTTSLWHLLSIESDLLNVNYKGRKIKLGVFPVSIDTPRIESLASSKSVLERVKEFKETYPNKVLLGVDRLDYSKGVELKLHAFKEFLKKYPEWATKVSFIQVAVPTRIDVEEYAQLKSEIDQLVGEINGKYGTLEHVPVRYIYQSVTEEDLLALYRMSDVLFVGSKRDGMNLVALEYVASQDSKNPGAVVLSEFTGASSILSAAIRVNPWNAHSTADGINEALQLTTSEKIQRHNDAISFLQGYTSQDWASSFMANLSELKVSPRHAQALFLDNESSNQSTKEFIQKVQEKNIALFVDFDGTLTPIEDHPEQVSMSDEVKNLIKALSEKPNLDIVVVSGRNKKYLAEQFKDLDVYLVSEHGANYYNYKIKRWRSLIHSNVISWIESAKMIMNDYTKRVPQSFIEKKEASLVWHYRLSPSLFASYQARKLADELDSGLSHLPAKIYLGKKNVEVKALEANKGDFVSWFLESHADKDFVAVAIGDDVTDEDMFNTLRKKGITVKVGPEDTQAQYRILEQNQITDILRAFL